MEGSSKTQIRKGFLREYNNQQTKIYFKLLLEQQESRKQWNNKLYNKHTKRTKLEEQTCRQTFVQMN